MFKCKEEGEKSGPDMDTSEIKTENHGHSLSFQLKGDTYIVTCNKPSTVQAVLQKDPSFKAICKKNQNDGQMELVILREQVLRAAITPDFPCCLLNNDELLDIKFIKSGGHTSTVKTQKLPAHTPETLISFYIRTRGHENIRMLMKNNALKNETDYVCVYAVKGEKVKVALRRDGRFNEKVFKRGVLYDQETHSKMNLSNPVGNLNGKQFEITISSYQKDSQESSQEMGHESETLKDDKSEVPETPQEKTANQDPTKVQEKKTDTPLKDKSRTYPDVKEIPNTQEVLKLLREMHGDLLKTLKERENLKNNVDVKKFFREEYDKSAQSFSEVKKLKQLILLSESVCQIRTNGFAVGTGFLLFDRFILTNAHVKVDRDTQTPRNKLTAVFGYEDLSSGNEIPLKENPVAYFFGKDDMGNYLDFALLELEDQDDSKKVQCLELLRSFSPPPTRGGVCIIGHPASGVKQIDPCFTIAKEEIPQKAERHLKCTPEILQLVTNLCFLEDRELRNSQIMYNSCFFHGSSGSPVFDVDCHLIGLHTGGYLYRGERNEQRSVMEYGLPICPILNQIHNQCKGRADVLQYFEKNMENILQMANIQPQREQKEEITDQEEKMIIE